MRDAAATRSSRTVTAVESETGLLPPGEYDVEVELDGLRRWAGRCRVDDGPEHTVLVEVGNGLVSITEGIPR
jgi:hypothetical protein